MKHRSDEVIGKDLNYAGSGPFVTVPPSKRQAGVGSQFPSTQRGVIHHLNIQCTVEVIDKT